MGRKSKILGTTSNVALPEVQQPVNKDTSSSKEKHQEKEKLHEASPDNLAQGEDLFNVEYSTSYSYAPADKFGDFTDQYYSLPIAWNEIFGAIAPTLASGANEKALVEPLNFLILKMYERHFGMKTSIASLCILKDSYHTIIIQMRALDLITDANEKRRYLEQDQYWKLTEMGEELMLKVRSVKKPCGKKKY